MGTDLEVDMNGSALIPAGIDRCELNSTIIVCNLIATQELLTSGVIGD